jgi:hypothetical protein
LLAAEILFCGLYRNVSEQELDLLKFTASTVAEASARAPKIMWREFRDSKYSCVLLHDVPNHLLCHFVAPNRTSPTDSPKKSAIGDVSRGQPIINGPLHPIGNWNGPNMARLANQINDSPVVFAALQML